MNEFVSEKASSYVSQNDVHMPELTVRETLAFAARCQGVGQCYEMLVELSRREKAANIMPYPDLDLYMKALEGQEINIITDFILKYGKELVINLLGYTYTYEANWVLDLEFLRL
ncbi:ABC transporter G member 44 [Ranunculus cassubicifolius]